MIDIPEGDGIQLEPWQYQRYGQFAERCQLLDAWKKFRKIHVRYSSTLYDRSINKENLTAILLSLLCLQAGDLTLMETIDIGFTINSFSQRFNAGIKQQLDDHACENLSRWVIERYFENHSMLDDPSLGIELLSTKATITAKGKEIILELADLLGLDAQKLTKDTGRIMKRENLMYKKYMHILDPPRRVMQTNDNVESRFTDWIYQVQYPTIEKDLERFSKQRPDLL